MTTTRKRSHADMTFQNVIIGVWLITNSELEMSQTRNDLDKKKIAR